GEGAGRARRAGVAAGERFGRHLAHRAGQIWWARRCRRLDRAHAECLRGAVRRWLCAPLFRRAARKLVRLIAPKRDARPSLLDDDRRTNSDQAIEFADVAVVHADTAVRDEAADQFRTIGAMDGILAAAQGE